jgi:hypothetical protein
MSPSFLNMFLLSSESIYEFYGKPIIYLTFYQLDIWGKARSFQRDMESFPNIPRDVQEDPDKLTEYVELNRNYKKAYPNDDDDSGGGGTIVGASKEDLKILGMEADSRFNFNEEIKKKGGKLTKEDILKLQGEI